MTVATASPAETFNLRFMKRTTAMRLATKVVMHYSRSLCALWCGAGADKGVPSTALIARGPHRRVVAVARAAVTRERP
jgi:hypothetical protein